MTKIEAIKIEAYDPSMGGKYDRYTGLCLSANNQTDPELLPEAYPKLDEVADKLTGGIIYHSAKQRAVQTGAYLAERRNIPHEQLADLNEVPFDVTQLSTAEEYAAERSKLVRLRFPDAFEADTLGEKRQNILERAYRIRELCMSTKEPAITLVSHSFFMKILEAILNDVPLGESPELLRNLINPDAHTFNFGEGFVVEKP